MRLLSNTQETPGLVTTVEWAGGAGGADGAGGAATSVNRHQPTPGCRAVQARHAHQASRPHQKSDYPWTCVR
eukprot:1800583-Prymnesium_polylepis.1